MATPIWSRSPQHRKTRPIMIDAGLLITGIAAALAFLPGRGKWLRHLLVISWLATLLAAAMGASMSSVVFLLTMLDMVIAGAALAITTHNPARYDARVVGAVSMMLMPAHWVMAWSEGAANWTLYAAACNGAFVVQCLIVGGWLDGVGRRLGRLFNRAGAVRSVRGGGR